MRQATRWIGGLFALGLLVGTAGFAQNSGPFVNYPVQFDVSPPMGSIPGDPTRREIKILTLHRFSNEPHPFLPDPVVQDTPGAPAAITPGIGFDGIGVGLGSYDPNVAPPDTNMAVGPNHIVQWVNLHWAIFDKSGNLQPGYPKPGNSFWSGFGGLCETNNNGDPIAQYDRLADRWHMSQFAFSAPFGPFLQCYAISTTPDPNGSYFRYAYSYADLPDYPKVGVWPVGDNPMYLSSYNMFAFGAFFSGARACAYDRTAQLAGNPSAVEICFQTSTSFHSLLPIDLDGPTAPPNGTPGIFLRFGTNVLQRWKLNPNFATPASSTFTGPTDISVAAFSEACGGGTCIPQSETTQQLDALADRLMYRLAYHNYGTHDSTVVNHAVTAGSGEESVGTRWYELRNINAAGAPTVHQQATFAPDNLFRWMGSIAMDKDGNMGLGYSVSASTMHPAIRFTGRLAADPAGTMQAETSMVEGTGSQIEGLGRWGDYSAMRIDPSDDCTFWFTTEYIKSNGTFNWSTRIGAFKHDTCGGPPPLPPLPPTNLVATAVSSSRIDLTWQDNSDNESGFKIERCSGDAANCTLPTATFTQIAQVGANLTSYSDTGLPASSTFSYRVKAFNSGGNSVYSNVDDATTLAANPPAAPSNLVATAVSSSQIDLNWTDNSNNEDGFKIERCTGTAAFCDANPTNFSQIAQVGANVASYSNTGLDSNTTYSYRVRAFNGDGNSAFSNTDDATTFQAPPAAPSNLTATAKRQGPNVWVDLAWQDNSNNETNFDIERCQGASCTNFAPLASVSTNVTTFTDNTVARRTTYRYQVKARNAVGSSAYSNIASATTK